MESSSSYKDPDDAQVKKKKEGEEGEEKKNCNHEFLWKAIGDKLDPKY